MKLPVIDLSECVDCDACIEACPAIFRRNAAGYIEVVDLSEYSEEEVAEAIKNCPTDCIKWQSAR
ncbi:MAG: ferredoxin [Deltaproteobacteria bacterium]|nr:ferredoxin [Deltaproteobacteria bacterium]